MNVIRADVLGMCFGVRDALKVVDNLDKPSDVTIHGQIVHNEQVLFQLEAQGFAMARETDRRKLPETPFVLITAHGVSDRERNRLQAAGKRLIDTTCPLVTRVHQAAQRLHADGFFVLVIGSRRHVEVQGIIEDLDRFVVIESVDEVATYPVPRLGIVSQTTATLHQVKCIVEAVESKNPEAEIHSIDTVCQPTKEHQRALERLLQRTEAVVVVGGRNSNNTRELVNLCRARGKPVHHITSADELDPDWVLGYETIGLTAGTSTLDATINAVHQALLDLPQPARSR